MRCATSAAQRESWLLRGDSLLGARLGIFDLPGRLRGLRLRHRIDVEIVILADRELLRCLGIIEDELDLTPRRRLHETNIFRRFERIVLTLEQRFARAARNVHHVTQHHLRADTHCRLPSVERTYRRTTKFTARPPRSACDRR